MYVNNKKNVVVLLSAYNGEKYIEKQVESIEKQTISDDVTLIIRNDGSTDDTLNILKKIAKKYSNIILINGKNIGLIRSFFALLEFAVKKYEFNFYAFSDQDDYWQNDKLESAIDRLNHEKGDIPLLYGCTSIIVDENLKPTGFKTQTQKKDITFFNSAIQNIIPGHNQVLNRKLATLLVDQSVNYSKIYSQDLWITNVAAVMGKIIFDNNPHTLYRMHGNNELGYGTSKFNRTISHLKRLNKKESKKIAMQLNYFYECYKKALTVEQRRELKTFFESQKKLKDRLRYTKQMRLYRQNDKETILLKALYLFKQYNI